MHTSSQFLIITKPHHCVPIGVSELTSSAGPCSVYYNISIGVTMAKSHMVSWLSQGRQVYRLRNKKLKKLICCSNINTESTKTLGSQLRPKGSAGLHQEGNTLSFKTSAFSASICFVQPGFSFNLFILSHAWKIFFGSKTLELLFSLWIFLIKWSCLLIT